ncbi:neurogenic locus notch homolog protein 4-like [Littorina saxatilis]|uniref:neurogenic locus notch homolog protein 4-like n=1 Tax=Littorina saxatilis TaxID=31220 RepID=UPI0038B6ACC4
MTIIGEGIRPEIKEQGECVSTSGTPNCIGNAECPATGNTEGKTPNKCTCNDEYTANDDKTMCEAKVGTPCDDSTPCVSGSTCDTTCKVNAGQSCAGGLTCVTTATCEGGTTCKIKDGQTCPADSTDCIAHATCHSDGSSLECTCGADYTVNGDSTQCEAKVGTPCDDSTPCVAGSTCDTTCKVNAGQSCAGGLTCVTTATCEGGTTCKIKDGQTCPADSTDCIAHATCHSDGSSLECTCGADYTVNGDSTQCEAKVGTPCDDSTPCVSGSTCDTTCKVNAGQSCAGGLTCVTTATCEGGTTCKIKDGQTCPADSTDCIAHATCHSDGSSLECTCGADYTVNGDSTQCEAKVGTPCDDSTPCVSGSTCDTTCKVNAGQSCVGGLTCVTTATCEGGTTCKIKDGQTCPADSTDCIAHATCHSDGSPLECTCGADYTVNGDSTQCEAKVGTPCDDSTPCVAGSTCDTTCKVNAGQSCAGGLTCVTTATCEGGTACKIKDGQTCPADSTDCIAHATCHSDGSPLECTCGADYTVNGDSTQCDVE